MKPGMVLQAYSPRYFWDCSYRLTMGKKLVKPQPSVILALQEAIYRWIEV